MRITATCLVSVLAASVLLSAQTRLDPAKLLKPGTDSWPTFNGDYTGRRFSAVNRITPANAHQLSLAWMFRTTFPGVAIKSTPLLVNGVLYFTIPDHVWAVDGGRAVRSGTTSGRRRAAITWGTAGSRFTRTGCISKRRTAT